MTLPTYPLLRFAFFCFATLALLAGCATDKSSYVIPGLNTDRQLEYETEKQKLLDRDPSVNFSTLRWAFRSSELYKAWDTQEHEASLAMFNAFEDENYALCMEFANAILALNFTSLSGHFGAYSCSTALEQPVKAAFHRYVISGLMESIELSGDGKSANTAYVTISPSETRGYMQIKGLTSYRQELVGTGAKYIEKFYAIDNASEESVELYFDNSATLVNLNRPTLPQAATE